MSKEFYILERELEDKIRDISFVLEQLKDAHRALKAFDSAACYRSDCESLTREVVDFLSKNELVGGNGQ